MKNLIEKIFGLSGHIRYVAIYEGGRLHSSSRPSIENASSAESDKYEELIVNPTLLKLVTQRGNIDCGGAAWVVIRYGSFFEFLMPVTDGHVSVGIHTEANLMETVAAIEKVVQSEYL